MSDKTQAYLLVLTQFILFALLGGALLFLPAGQVGWARILGILVMLAGLAAVFGALWTYYLVNKTLVNVSPEPNQSAHLVEVGLYRWIRHPIYMGAILTAFGAALAHGHGASIGVAIALLLFFTYKSTFEERWLLRVYPDYAAYRRRTGRFWPPLRRSDQA